jgi:N-methylhydantoinase A
MMRGAGRTAGLPIDQVFEVQATAKPEPFVQRADVIELHERIAADGQVLAGLDSAGARRLLQERLGEPGAFDGVAVCLLWSFRNDIHERLVGELLRELYPDIFVSLSSQTAPRQGEYERAVATVVNSYVGPSSVDYLERLTARLRDAGFAGELLVMQSSGGVASIEQARKQPIALIGSGPAGGVSGVVALAARAGHPNVIATDMGGTSFEVGLIVQGRPVIASQQVVDQQTFNHPHLDARSIACGGGSVAAIGPGGGLRVGPRSAGSSPGPAAYGRGGGEPTVTDADLVLGLLSPGSFLGGRMELDEAAARAAVQELARSLDLTLEETAAGIVQVNNFAAATLIRQRTLEQGLDPRDFVVYAYGGAGPLHAFGFAAELDVAEVLVPLGNGASTLSAFGIAAGDLVRHTEIECRMRVPAQAEELAAVVGRAEDAARAGFPGQQPVLRRVALMRYAEQYLQSLAIELPDGELDAAAASRLLADFDAEYGRQFGEFAKALFQAVEIFAIRVEARVQAHSPEVLDRAPAEPAVPTSSREVFWPGHGPARTAVWSGLELAGAQQVEGPAVVELPHTTVAVAPGQRLSRDEHSASLRLRLRDGDAR